MHKRVGCNSWFYTQYQSAGDKMEQGVRMGKHYWPASTVRYIRWARARQIAGRAFMLSREHCDAQPRYFLKMRLMRPHLDGWARACCTTNACTALGESSPRRLSASFAHGRMSSNGVTEYVGRGPVKPASVDRRGRRPDAASEQVAGEDDRVEGGAGGEVREGLGKAVGKAGRPLWNECSARMGDLCSSSCSNACGAVSVDSYAGRHACVRGLWRPHDDGEEQRVTAGDW
mmetsp:Transcript_10198/g.17818  ORF Transcript_10198/g.17818 Transcript_10198/m.17818 type:complete len:230 (-) Transcript_10198:472-1161(-)